LPVYNAEACHMNLRRSVLYGYEVDNEDARDNAMLAKTKEDLKVVVPRLFKQRKIVSLADVPFRSQESTIYSIPDEKRLSNTDQNTRTHMVRLRLEFGLDGRYCRLKY
jgi:hypothetical protein